MSDYKVVVVGTDGSDTSLRAVDKSGSDRRGGGRETDRGHGIPARG